MFNFLFISFITSVCKKIRPYYSFLGMIFLLVFLSGCVSSNSQIIMPDNKVNINSSTVSISDEAKWMTVSYIEYDSNSSYVLMGDEVFSIGGGTGSVINDVFSVNINTGVLKKKKNLNFARGGSCAAVVSSSLDGHVEQKIFVYGGIDINNNLLKTAELFDVEKSEWRVLSEAPLALKGAVCIGIGTLAVIVGGYLSDDSVNNRTLIYNFYNNTWSFGHNLLKSRVCGGIGIYDNRILYAGGKEIDDSGYMIESKRVDIFDPVANTWQIFSELPSSFSNCGIVFYNNKIICGGGVHENNITNETVSFDISNQTWSPGPILKAGNGLNIFSKYGDFPICFPGIIQSLK